VQWPPSCSVLTDGHDAVNIRFLQFCASVLIKAKNPLCADYCHQPVNSSTLLHSSWNYVQQYFFQIPSRQREFRESRLKNARALVAQVANISWPICTTFGIDDVPKMLFGRSVCDFHISWSCESRILITDLNECFPYFLHFLPHSEIVQYEKCTNVFSDFQLHKNGALIDMYTIFIPYFTHLFSQVWVNCRFHPVFTWVRLGSVCPCRPVIHLNQARYFLIVSPGSSLDQGSVLSVCITR
jgi:hypothetical protein